MTHSITQPQPTDHLNFSAGLSFPTKAVNPAATVLIVDDSPDNLRVLSATLSQSNYDIRCAKNGTMALKALALNSPRRSATAELPDLILLDIQMPDIDGYEVCARLKANARTQHIPIIFISALDAALDKVKAFAVGGVDYITKPFQMEEVIVRVQNQLNLQAAKAQLAQAEKMASLGQLVAGIAHEINNPVGFVQGNIDYLDNYVQDLLTLLKAYQQQYPDPPEGIRAIAANIDLPHIQADLPNIVKSMTLGTERIASIVSSLRNFSRLDESEHKPADIHEGIDSTLLILESRLKASDYYSSIEVIKQYQEMPPVLCYPGSLNQVFMNLIANAIDAIEDKQQTLTDSDQADYQPQIVIQTEQTAQAVTIRIQDNGHGMEESVKARLFNPFFTTKPVGKGTGLGLAISSQIIHEKHHGQLTCQSQAGIGTEFVITLPFPQDLV
ncbi:MAG: hybrid sensor histidine kinase/response regulator [Phormidesmis priestleyi]|uniref:histidine kinase n=1 Tax=Phormidesmis priestleyi TaxID=268141 RepID=A0A2W4XEE2_9CYAN|nr:MAG: hybrid sensor histidine kinase/response regulator [Phormidesmis priestleyi]